MSMLNYLFESELEFPWSWKEEARYGDDTETVRQLKKRVEDVLSEDQRSIWDEYHSMGQRLHDLECRKEFERGFILGVKLLMEAAGRAEDAAY